MNRFIALMGISAFLLTACQGADGPAPLPAPTDAGRTQSSIAPAGE